MDGVVFDFDGVIAQSMEQHAEAYRRTLEPFGIPVQQEQIFALEGARSETIIEELATAAGQRVDAAELANQKQRIFAELGPVALYPGAAELVRAASRRGPVAIVTGTRKANLERIAPDLLPLLGAVVTQESYRHDKPHPEPYLVASKGLGLEPKRLTCVENAVRGIESARAAGYGRIVAIATTMPAESLQADDVVADHAQLAALLAQ